MLSARYSCYGLNIDQQYRGAARLLKPSCLPCSTVRGRGAQEPSTTLSLPNSRSNHAAGECKQARPGDECKSVPLGLGVVLSASSGYLVFTPSSAASTVCVNVPDWITHFNLWSFLLSNPLITLAVAFVLFWVLPHLLKVTIRFVVLPVVVLLALALAVNNPDTVASLANSILDLVKDHPFAISAAILLLLGLSLTPYLIQGSLLCLLGLFLASRLGLIETPRLPPLPTWGTVQALNKIESKLESQAKGNEEGGVGVRGLLSRDKGPSSLEPSQIMMGATDVVKGVGDRFQGAMKSVPEDPQETLRTVRDKALAGAEHVLDAGKDVLGKGASAASKLRDALPLDEVSEKLAAGRDRVGEAAGKLADGTRQFLDVDRLGSGREVREGAENVVPGGQEASEPPRSSFWSKQRLRRILEDS